MAATVASAMAASTSNAPTELNETLLCRRGSPAAGVLADGAPDPWPAVEPEPGPEFEVAPEPGCAECDPLGCDAPPLGEGTGTLDPVGLSGGGGYPESAAG